MKPKNTLTRQDTDLLQCTFDSNAISSRITRAKSPLNNISEVDLILMDDKKTAKEIKKLKELLDQAEKLADEITSKYYDAKYKESLKYF
jgi:hypothetical protein